MSQQFLCPIVQATVNGNVVTQPKYANQFGITLFAAIPYGGEKTVCVLSLPSANSSLSAQSDIYTFGDLTQPLNDEEVAILETYLSAYNVPTDGLVPGSPNVVNLLYILKSFLCAQAVFGVAGQPIFTNGITLSSPSSSVPAISSVLSPVAVQPPQMSQGVGNVGGSGGSGGSSTPPTPPFNFSAISNGTTVGEFLDAASTTYSGGPISLGGFA